MSKCKGCGITLQWEDKTKVGYTPKKDNKLCERCFKITNYNYHENESKNIDNMDIIKGINSKKCATLFLCDILSLNQNNIDIYNVIDGEKILVITKCDIIPRNINLDSLKRNIERVYHVNDVLFISTLSGFGKKDLLEYIYKHKKVLFAGPTSSGKSSLINFLFGFELTVSNYKNTTQEFVSLKVEDQTIIDAPGFNDYLSSDYSGQTGYIIPKTISIKKGYSLCVGNAEMAFNDDVNVTLFFPKKVIATTKKTKNKLDNKLVISKSNDLVIYNLGFIYFKDSTEVQVNNNAEIEVRLSIIGGIHE